MCRDRSECILQEIQFNPSIRQAHSVAQKKQLKVKVTKLVTKHIHRDTCTQTHIQIYMVWVRHGAAVL